MKRFGKKVFFLVVILPTLALGAPPSRAGEKFLPVNIGISCRADTDNSNKEQYLRAPEAGPEVSSTECLDKSKAIKEIYPESVDVEYISKIQLWMVVLTLDEKKSEILKSISSSNLGQKLIVGVDGKVLSAETLFAPVISRVIYINVETREEGYKLMARFMRSKSR
ncbi:hypothetical protein [Burkholderia pseudomallei]|uniref:hypothetical protein n=1 Tax=Burkholderia pseudomallei TaxID=28450 RepID=UPI0027DFCBE6|nr:hypothetical protein [Burkholderia pseudomallei]